MNSKKNIKIFDDANKLFEIAATFIIELANKSIKEKGRFTIALSGGHTPEQLYSLLAQEPFCKQMPWKNIFVFWGDERCVPYEDEQSNERMAALLLLNKVEIPFNNIYPIPVNLSPAQAAEKYESEINDFFKNDLPQFDLILLGLGENGHTASLFPDTEVLNEKKYLVKEVFVDEVKMFRVTMTLPLINHASNIIFLVTGKQKAMIVKNILNTSSFQSNKYPAQLINPEKGELYWFIDSEAAALI